MKAALIFREHLLDSTDRFVLDQAKLLRSYRPVLVGLLPADSGLNDSIPAILLRNGQSPINKAAVNLYRKLPIAPGFFQRLRTVKPAVIHAQSAADAPQALTIARVLDLPLIVSLRLLDVIPGDGAPPAGIASRGFGGNRKRLFQEAAAFVCPSRFIRDAATKAGFPESRLHVHQMGIDCQRFSDADQERDPKLILFVGSLVQKKECEYLLRAMSLLQRHDPEARLEIIGDGPLRSRLESIAASLSLHASFRGAQDAAEVSRSLSRARVLCNPSMAATSGDMEGLCMAFAEAQAAGTPVVSSSDSATAETVSHGHTGLLCPEGNVFALADSLRALLNDDVLWTSISNCAREWASVRFDIVKRTASLEMLYDECVAARSRRGSRAPEQAAWSAHTESPLNT